MTDPTTSPWVRLFVLASALLIALNVVAWVGQALGLL